MISLQCFGIRVFSLKKTDFFKKRIDFLKKMSKMKKKWSSIFPFREACL